jgi:hypothetical protein
MGAVKSACHLRATHMWGIVPFTEGEDSDDDLTIASFEGCDVVLSLDFWRLRGDGSCLYTGCLENSYEVLYINEIFGEDEGRSSSSSLILIRLYDQVVELLRLGQSLHLIYVKFGEHLRDPFFCSIISIAGYDRSTLDSRDRRRASITSNAMRYFPNLDWHKTVQSALPRIGDVTH